MPDAMVHSKHSLAKDYQAVVIEGKDLSIHSRWGTDRPICTQPDQTCKRMQKFVAKPLNWTTSWSFTANTETLFLFRLPFFSSAMVCDPPSPPFFHPLSDLVSVTHAQLADRIGAGQKFVELITCTWMHNIIKRANYIYRRGNQTRQAIIWATKENYNNESFL